MDELPETPENGEDLLILAVQMGLVSDADVGEARRPGTGPEAVLAAFIRDGKLSSAEIDALSVIARGRASRHGESQAGSPGRLPAPAYTGEPVQAGQSSAPYSAEANTPQTGENALQVLRTLRNDLRCDEDGIAYLPEAARHAILTNWTSHSFDMLQGASGLEPHFRPVLKDVLDRLTCLLNRETGIHGKSAKEYRVNEWDRLITEQSALLEEHQARLDRLRAPPPAATTKTTAAMEAKALREAEEEASLLAEEISSIRPMLPALPRRERNAQVSVWAGRFRKIQDRIGNPFMLPDALRATLDQLLDIAYSSGVGTIHPLRRAFVSDWDAFISENQARLEQLRGERVTVERTEVEDAAAQAEEVRRREEEKAGQEAELEARRHDALDEIGAVLSRSDPRSDPSPFLAAVREGLRTLSPADIRLHRLVEPFSDLLVGKDFRRLRAKLSKGEEKEARLERMAEEERDMTAWTRGKRAVMIGGDPREKARAKLEEFFGFESLEWRHAAGHDPRQIQALADSVRSGGCDVVVVLIKFTGHDVQESLRKVCKAAGIPFIFADSYGIRGIAKNLRKALGTRVGDPDKS